MGMETGMHPCQNPECAIRVTSKGTRCERCIHQGWSAELARLREENARLRGEFSDEEIERFRRAALEEKAGLCRPVVFEGWPRPIPCSERMPEDAGEVVAFIKGKWRGGNHLAALQNWIAEGIYYDLSDVTYWLALPPIQEAP